MDLDSDCTSTTHAVRYCMRVQLLPGEPSPVCQMLVAAVHFSENIRENIYVVNPNMFLFQFSVLEIRSFC